MSQTENLHRGAVIRHQGHLYTLLDYRVSQSGKMKPTVHLKLRDLKSGNTGERSLDELGKVEEVPTEIRNMQYLYAAGKDRVFMDSESFDEQRVAPDFFGRDADFLVEGETYRFLAIDGQPVSLQLPPVIAIEVADTAPVEHAGGMSNITKEARLASGLTIRVPLFIKTGDKVRVRVDNHEYQGKEH
jgi:elongation factor P